MPDSWRIRTCGNGPLQIRLNWQMSGCGIIFTLLLSTGCGRSTSTPPPTPSGPQESASVPSVAVKVTDVDRQDHRVMVDQLKQLASEAGTSNIYYGNGRVAEMRQQAAAIRQRMTPVQQTQFDAALGTEELHLGEEREAIRRLRAALKTGTELYRRKLVPGEAYYDLMFMVGVAYLRYGETQNCCLRHNADSCLMPIQGGGVHTEQQGSRKAIDYFLAVLRGAEKKSKLYYEALWLLNIAYMTVDEYPNGVPAEYRIPPSAFGDAKTSFPRFQNIATELGLDTFGMAGGAVADDFDGDGRIDLLVGSWDLREQLQLFRNEGGNHFANRTTSANLVGIPGGLNMLQADYNNDGHVDVIVLRGAWLFDQGQHPNSLLRNNGDGTFSDVTVAAGLAKINLPTQTAAWADYDLDGDVDLYVGNEPVGNQPTTGQLYQNQGDGTFRDVAAEAGVENLRFAKGVVWGDVNNDRFPDLFISNLKANNRLYVNQGDGRFVDTAADAGLGGFDASFPAFFWDFNNDGHLDLLVASYLTTTHLIAKRYLGETVNNSGPRLYQGHGDGTFRDISQAMGLDEPSFSMGVNFGDLDNDGFLDFYLGTGSPDYEHLVPNKMYRNVGGQQFEDVSYSGGFSQLQKGHAVTFADFDEDGDLDIFEQMGGAYFGDRYADAYYQNPGFGNHWLAVEAVGTTSNRSAIGARITAFFDDDGLPRRVHRVVNSGGSFGANPLRQTLGLREADSVDRLEIFWPRTGVTQVFEEIKPNQVIRVIEGKLDYERPVRRP